MRICLINYRYFVSSGPERYLFAVKRLLEERGHEVVPFSVRYRQNEPSPWDDYFVPPIAGVDEIMFRQHSWSASSVRRALERSVYSREVNVALSRLLRDARPDAAYVLKFMRKLSPSILTALRDHAVPVAIRFSDFDLICAQQHLLRDGRVCELCVGKGLWHSVRYRCVQRSFAASAVNAVGVEYARWRGYFGLVDAFVAPSDIMRQKMIEGGLSASRINHIPTFVEARPARPWAERVRRVAFVGRIAPEKGLDVLLDAIELLHGDGVGDDVEFVVAGDLATPLGRAIEVRLRLRPIAGVRLTGQLGEADVTDLLQSSQLSVVPSLWYENMPNSLLESLACGTPVIASDFGSMRDMLAGTGAGLLFRSGDPVALAEALREGLTGRCAETMGAIAGELARERHDPARHIDALVELLESMQPRR